MSDSGTFAFSLPKKKPATESDTDAFVRQAGLVATHLCNLLSEVKDRRVGAAKALSTLNKFISQLDEMSHTTPNGSVILGPMKSLCEEIRSAISLHLS